MSSRRERPSSGAGDATYRAYYPTRETLRETWLRIVHNFGLEPRFEHLERDVDHVVEAMVSELGGFRPRANFQIQVLASLFYRNKAAYMVGKIINGFTETPFALPILHGPSGDLLIDAALFSEDDLLMTLQLRARLLHGRHGGAERLRAVPAQLMPSKRAELYNALGLQKQGKTLFYRDFLDHLRHSTDQFRIAPGIKGMVMLVFTLPSFPYVFKVIKDFYPPQKETTREKIMSKYLLVKTHDRVGRMADTLEYASRLAASRFDDELVAELQG